MEPGTILAGKYRLEALLGRGGMGSVWRARHLALNAPIAVKLISSEASATEMALTRFKREAKAAAALRSPHVVQILDHGTDAATGTPFIAMELLEGQSLAGRLEGRGWLSPRETAQVVVQVARALTRAHAAGIVHRDLKPDNIFLVQNEDEELAKVLDFGIAKDRALSLGDAVTSTGMVIGTAFYMSPEQISGSRLVDHRTDLWALGVIACECLTGEKPFRAETLGGLVLEICSNPLPVPSSRRPVPAGFDAWFARAVARDTQRRFQSAREMAHALEALVTDPGARRPSAAPPQVGTPSCAAAANNALGELGAPTFSAAYHPVTPAPGRLAPTHTGMPVSSSRDSGVMPQPALRKGRWGWIVAGLLGLAGVTTWLVWPEVPAPEPLDVPLVVGESPASRFQGATAPGPSAAPPPSSRAKLHPAPSAVVSIVSGLPGAAGAASTAVEPTPVRRRRPSEGGASPAPDHATSGPEPLASAPPPPPEPPALGPAPAPLPGRDLLDTRK